MPGKRQDSALGLTAFPGQRALVIAFHLGSLHFLIPFDFENFHSQTTQVMQRNVAVVLQSRLKVWVMKDLGDKMMAVPSGIRENRAADLDTGARKQVMQYQILNEVVMERSSYLSNVKVYLDRHLITKLHGNTTIISSLTGNTVYAAAASASMIHSNMPTIVIMPICSHLLSFQLTVDPRGDEPKIMLSLEAMNARWVVFRLTKETKDPPTRQHRHPYLLLPTPFHLHLRPCEQPVLYWNMQKKHFTEVEGEEG